MYEYFDYFDYKFDNLVADQTFTLQEFKYFFILTYHLQKTLLFSK